MKNFVFAKILLLLACILAVISFVTAQPMIVLLAAAFVLMAFISLVAAEPEKPQPKIERSQPVFEKQEPAAVYKPQPKHDSPLHAYASKSDAEAPKNTQAVPLSAQAVSPVQAVSSSEELNNEKIAVLNKFASVASHDLKNPLSSMKNIAYYFTHSVRIDGEVPNKMLKMLGSEVDRMNNMIVELLDVTRVKQLNLSVCDLDVLVNEAVEKESTQSVSFDLHIEKVRANVDPERFKQAVKNIIANAKDASPEGGTIIVKVFRVGRYAVVEISDNGIGMDKTTLAKCFDPMFTTKTTRSLGMSLTVAKQIITMSGGSIKAESVLGSGSKFTIQLPLAS